MCNETNKVDPGADKTQKDWQGGKGIKRYFNYSVKHNIKNNPQKRERLQKPVTMFNNKEIQNTGRKQQSRLRNMKDFAWGKSPL